MVIPWGVMDHNWLMSMAADVMFVIGNQFLVTITRKIKFIIVQCLAQWTESSLQKSLYKVLALYKKNITINKLFTDG